MKTTNFKRIATFMIKISGIVVTFVSMRLFWISLYFGNNLIDILSPRNQFNVSFLRLIWLFILNIISIAFDWFIAVLVFVLGIAMILYKTKTMDKIVDSEMM